MEQRVYPVKKNGEYTVRVDSLAFGGHGVARIEDYVLFVKRALPGDTVKVRIRKRKKSYAEAAVLEIVEPSALRVDAPCPYFRYCGGCTWQNMTYAEQLVQKQKIVADSVKHIAGLGSATVLPVLASDKPFAYRNKMEFSFADRKWLFPEDLGNPDISKDFALGLHVPGTFDKIIHIEHCLLQDDVCNEVLRFVSDYAREQGMPPYGIRSHEGLLRFLVLRKSHSSGEVMVNIVTSAADKRLKPMAESLAQRFPAVTSIVNNINSRKAQIAQGEEEHLLYGEPFIKDKIGSFEFRISANSFFQTNTAQAEKLYDTALDFAAISGKDEVWDLYSGTGTISLFLAGKARHVTGFELVESAVADARENATEHGFDNCTFIAGDVRDNMLHNRTRPDIILTDPPRAGMHEDVVKAILETAPRRVVYVSCNPTTMARDIKLMENDYRLEKVQPVDMFPQTYHIECVALLERR